MFSLFGFEYYSIGEDCPIRNESYTYDGLLLLLVWSFVVVCAFALSKVVCHWWHAQGAMEYALRQCGGNTKDSQFAVNQQKFLEQGWKLMATGFIMAFGFYVVFWSGEVTASELRSWNSRWPQRHTSLMEWYYRIALGYHLFRTANQFFEARRGDFIALMIHHWITIGLIVCSKMCQVTEVGILVMIVHDNSDFLLSAGKVLIYDGNWPLLRNAVSTLFVCSWVGSRICAYSYFVLLPYLRAVDYSCHALYWAFALPLFGLLVLHFYWLIPIVHMTLMMIRKSGEVIDYRSDAERFQKFREKDRPKTK